MSAMQRRKGARVEREIVNRHKELGVHAERVVMSGAVKGRRMGEGHDVDIYLKDRAAPICAEVKAGAQVPKFCLSALGENDAVFFRRDNAEPVVMVPWRMWAEMVKR
jgi:Holliday junction resolvase